MVSSRIVLYGFFLLAVALPPLDVSQGQRQRLLQGPHSVSLDVSRQTTIIYDCLRNRHPLSFLILGHRPSLSSQTDSMYCQRAALHDRYVESTDAKAAKDSQGACIVPAIDASLGETGPLAGQCDSVVSKNRTRSRPSS